MAGIVSYVKEKWLPPPTIDDLMWEVSMNIWHYDKERAKRQLIWLMDRYLGDTDDEETAVSEGEGSKGEEGEGGGAL